MIAQQQSQNKAGGRGAGQAGYNDANQNLTDEEQVMANANRHFNQNYNELHNRDEYNHQRIQSRSPQRPETIAARNSTLMPGGASSVHIPDSGAQHSNMNGNNLNFNNMGSGVEI